MQQKICGFSDGTLNGRYIGNDMQLAKGPNTSDGCLTDTLYDNSSEPLQQQSDQHQQPLIQGDGYGMNAANPSRSATSYNTVIPAESMMNTQEFESNQLAVDI